MTIAQRLKTPLLSLGITAALAFTGVAALNGQNRTASNGVPVTVTVTATGHDSRAGGVAQNEVVVRQDGDVRQVVSWKPAAENAKNLDLAIMIDDQLSRRISSNLN